MAAKRFIMNAGRTSKQGQQINVGKDHAEYQAIVNTLIMHADDMKEAGNLLAGGTRARFAPSTARPSSSARRARCPPGMIFVPYGPPTCRLMGGDTDGTGMPTSKGWEVEVEPIVGEPQRSRALTTLGEERWSLSTSKPDDVDASDAAFAAEPSGRSAAWEADRERAATCRAASAAAAAAGSWAEHSSCRPVRTARLRR